MNNLIQFFTWAGQKLPPGPPMLNRAIVFAGL